MAGENYTFPLPTEKLKTELAEVKEKLNRTRAALIVAEQAKCPDIECPNCRKWRNWEARNGDVTWLLCLACGARVGHPCRRVVRGTPRDPNYRPPILMRPHKGRPWVRDPQA